MFDKLIASEPAGADIKNRRSYFLVSSLVVGVLFLTAVVFSIYAADYGLGDSNFDLVEMVMPPDMTAAVEPKPEPQQIRATQSDLPIRQTDIDRVENSTLVPDSYSVVPNSQRERPLGRYRIGNFDSDEPGDAVIGRSTEGAPGNAVGLGNHLATIETPDEAEPPPARVEPAKRDVVRSIGVVNGKATYLPVPPYPPTARAIGLQGKVDVQVMIDETGKVISATAVSGHAFLRGPAEKAAWNARFTPTTLSKVPIKVTGVIVYNFTR